MKRKLLALAWLVCALSVFTTNADVPPLINYQGTLTDSSGQPISGIKRLEFNIYDAPIAGNKVWGPQIFNQVPVINGRFNVILGATDVNGDLISGAFASENRFLELVAENLSETGPRQQILSAPFSLHASYADFANIASSVEGDNLFIDSASGGVGIGTNDPQAKFEVRGETRLNGVASITGGLKPDYDSGWYQENSFTTHVTTKEHGLGDYPSRIQVWFSETDPPTGFIIPVPLTTYSQPGGIEAMRMDKEKIEYGIPGGELIAHWWDGYTKSFTSGYYRVLLWR